MNLNNSTFGESLNMGIEQDAIMEQAKALNYWGKKLDKSRQAVCTVIAENLEIDYNNVVNFLAGAAKPVTKKEAIAKIDTRPISGGTLSHAEGVRPVLAGQKFLVTSAQNNTDVHGAFLKCLETYAVHIGAKILVFPFVYNINGFQNGTGSKEEIWYDPAIIKYMQKEDAWLGEAGKVAAMAYNILPTVKNPLAGMREAIGGAEAMIIPHATIAHECVPVLGAQFGRTVPQMYSTGAVTQKNYIQQQAGQKAANRHNFGALIVEFNEHGAFWVRQIETDESGAFQDMRTAVHNMPSGHPFVSDMDIAAINYGDIHAEQVCPKVAAIQWGLPDIKQAAPSMLDYLRPSHQMMHDLLDFQSLNGHERHKHLNKAKNQYFGRTVADDLKAVSDVLESVQRTFCQTVIVYSNHDDSLSRWLADDLYNPRNDPANAITYYSLQVKAHEAIKAGVKLDALPVALAQETDCTASPQFLRPSESYKVGPVELGEHGHAGINGARGSNGMYSAYKVTTGHTHSSSIKGGQYVAGVSGKLAMGYNETGASSWVHACVIQYQNGFRSVIHVKNDGNGNLDYRA